jgi:peptidoglycan hydrolase CwlO-like protein
MKKWFWIILIIIVIFLILGFLYSEGLIKVKWQFLAMVLAAAAAPFNLIKNYLAGGTGKTDKILERQKDRVDKEKKRRARFDVYMKQKDEKINELESEVVVLKDEISNTELEIEQNEKDINNMTEIEDLQNAFMEGYSDES